MSWLCVLVGHRFDHWHKDDPYVKGCSRCDAVEPVRDRPLTDWTTGGD